MAVLVEGISVIIRRDAIDELFPGGFTAFVAQAPNHTLCYDDDLVRIGFMVPDDVALFVESLRQHDLIYLFGEKAVHLVVADQQQGLLAPCDWANCYRAVFDKSLNQHICICAKTDGDTSDVSVPHGWQFAASLSERFSGQQTPLSEMRFIRHEEGLDIYQDPRSGDEIQVARLHNRPTASDKTH